MPVTKLFPILFFLPLLFVACAPATGTNPDSQGSFVQSSGSCDGLGYIREYEAAYEANPHRTGQTFDFEARGCLEGEITALPRMTPRRTEPGGNFIGEWDVTPTGIFVEAKIDERRGFIIKYSHERDQPPEHLQSLPLNLTPEQEAEWDEKTLAFEREQDRLYEQSLVDWEKFVLEVSVGDKIQAECTLLKWGNPTKWSKGILGRGATFHEGTDVHMDCVRIGK